MLIYFFSHSAFSPSQPFDFLSISSLIFACGATFMTPLKTLLVVSMVNLQHCGWLDPEQWAQGQLWLNGTLTEVVDFLFYSQGANFPNFQGIKNVLILYLNAVYQSIYPVQPLVLWQIRIKNCNPITIDLSVFIREGC